MTEPRLAAPRPRFLPTALAAIACFLVIFEFLAFRLRAGSDPALGGTSAKTAAVARPTVIDRKLITRRVVHLPARPQSASAGTAASTAVVSTAPSTAPPAAPAPAPAPAPPVTSSS